MPRRAAVMVKRLSHRPFTAEELRVPIVSMVDDSNWPSQAPQFTNYIKTAKFDDGRTFHSHWRDSVSYCLMMVAREPTWMAQRTELLRLCVNAASWIAAANALLPKHRDDPESWRDIVAGSAAFANTPLDLWPALLQSEYVQNTLSMAVMLVVGSACFGIPTTYGDAIAVFERLRQSSDAMRVGLVHDVSSLNDDLPYERWFVTRRLKSFVLPTWQAIDSFFQRMADDLAAMRPIHKYGKEWERLATEHNEQLLRILADLQAPLGAGRQTGS